MEVFAESGNGRQFGDIVGSDIAELGEDLVESLLGFLDVGRLLKEKG